MHIGFDAKRAFFNNTGLGNYSRALLQALTDYFPEHTYTLYSPKQEGSELEKLDIAASENIKVHCPNSDHGEAWFGGSLWRSFRLGRQIEKDHLDIYHGLSHELPFDSHYNKAKKVVTIHDLIFMRYPKLYPFFDRWMYRQKWKHSCQVADKIIAISEQTKRDIISFLNIAEQKIEVIYQSVNPIFYDYSDLIYLQHGILPENYTQNPYDLPEDYVLYVGSVTERKNVLTIVKAIHQLKESQQLAVPLVIVGGGKQYKAKVEQYVLRHQLNKQVLFLNHIPTQDLPIIYRKAKLFVYPSIFEGFGLPIVEALFSHTPVIAATGSSLEEAGGPHSQYINPNDIAALAHTIQKVLTDTDLQETMRQEGWQYAQQFRQQNMGSQVMQLYQEL